MRYCERDIGVCCVEVVGLVLVVVVVDCRGRWQGGRKASVQSLRLALFVQLFVS